MPLLYDSSDWDEDQNTMGALGSVTEREQGGLGGNAASGLDVNGAVRRLSQENSLIPGLSPIDEYVKRARGFSDYITGMGERAEKQEQDALSNLRKEKPSRTPAWLAFASGMFSPTAHGKFAENLSLGLGNAAPFAQGYSRERGAHSQAIAQLQSGVANRGYNRNLQGIQFQAGLEDTIRKRMFAEAFLRKIQESQQARSGSPSLPPQNTQSFPVPDRAPQGRPLSPGVGPSDFAPSDTLPAWYRGWEGERPRGYQAGGLAQQGGVSELPGGGWSREGENEIGVSLPEALGYSLGSEQNFLPWFNAGRPDMIEIKQGRNSLLIDKKTGRLMGVVPQELSPSEFDRALEWRTKLPAELSVSGGKNMLESASARYEKGITVPPFASPNINIPPIPGYGSQGSAQGPGSYDVRSAADVFPRDAQGAPAANPVAQPRPVPQRAPAASVSRQPDPSRDPFPEVSPHPEVALGKRPPTSDEKGLTPKQRDELRMDRTKVMPVMRNALEDRDESMGAVMEQVGDIKKLIHSFGLPVTGSSGSLVSYIGSSDAAKLREAITTLKASTAFQKLQNIRDASKTGGAVGQASDTDIRLLSSVLGPMDPDRLSKKSLETNLDRIVEHMQNAYKNLDREFQSNYPEHYGRLQKEREDYKRKKDRRSQFEVLPRTQ